MELTQEQIEAIDYFVEALRVKKSEEERQAKEQAVNEAVAKLLTEKDTKIKEAIAAVEADYTAQIETLKTPVIR